MTPQYEKAIDTMYDIVNSKLPWTMVLYGEEVETQLMTSQDPIEKAFWDGKTVVDFYDFPYETIKTVIERKEITVEWFAHTEILLKRYLRRQNGEHLIHRSKEPITSVQSGDCVNVIMFNKINPWTERFSRYIQMYNEVGMFEIWNTKHIEIYVEKYYSRDSF